MKSSNVPRLIGNRIILCPRRSDDEAISLYMTWINDEDIAWRIGRNVLLTGWDEEERWAKQESREFQWNFNIVDKETDTLIGTCEIRAKPHGSTAYLGILIGDHNYLGKGYGRETISMLIAYCFDELRYHKVSLRVDGDNIRAIRCYSNCGFVKCGVLVEEHWSSGHWHDTICMEMLEDSYYSKSKVISDTEG